MKDLKKYIVSKNITIKEALKILDTNVEKCLFATDNKSKLIGSLTDGDVRRAILKRAVFNSKIEKHLNKNPTCLSLRDYKLKKFKINSFKNEDFKLLPVLDSSRKIVKIINLEKEFYKKNDLNVTPNTIPVLIMAGGRGTRLKPYTDIIPKPLVPINGKSMIEHILINFSELGFRNFFVSLNYKSDLVKTFFSFLKKRYKINFLNEKKPLGTAGVIKKINLKKENNFFVINCDTILKCDYMSLYNFHLKKKYKLTLVASQQENSIPYGVCKLNKLQELKKISEKPSQNIFVNTGCYVINSSVLKYVKKDQKVDMDQLIAKLLKKKIKIGVFPVQKDDWSDFGKITDFVAQ